MGHEGHFSSWKSLSLQHVRICAVTLRRQRQGDPCEFEASLVYRVSSRTARATQRNPVLKKQTGKKQNKTKQKPTEFLPDLVILLTESRIFRELYLQLCSYHYYSK